MRLTVRAWATILSLFLSKCTQGDRLRVLSSRCDNWIRNEQETVMNIQNDILKMNIYEFHFGLK